MEFKDIRTNTEGLVKLLGFLASEDNITNREGQDVTPSNQIFYLKSARGDTGLSGIGFVDKYNVTIDARYEPAPNTDKLLDLIKQIIK